MAEYTRSIPGDRLTDEPGATRRSEDPYLDGDDVYIDAAMGDPTRPMPAKGEPSEPIRKLRDLDNRVRLLLVIAGLTVLNLILLLAMLAQLSRGPAIAEVTVEGVPCVVLTGEDANQLYCQR